MRRAGLGPVEPPEMTPADPAETTENTVPEVVFEDETMYGWPDRIRMDKSAKMLGCISCPNCFGPFYTVLKSPSRRRRRPQGTQK